ncbi:type I-E CRISPR-associated protein Cse2/CasB [Frigidibacter mobilis]|uniref:CRISPR system Cascade subunit CasB n=1 Tax=Frigidibacter mobilis TaxID=1335048 RepID=A0A159ZB33_9RHOB|nr:type I-E CRISPR-associated protein Cse2/CasB [Frigidibacter mobilis]AMY72198.1 hypothetical protein AKL17_3p0042 [Frigidibacter mobilis]
MSETETAILGWWRQTLRPEEDTAFARALRARLRRADSALEVLSEPGVQRLVRPDVLPFLRARPLELARLAQVLAGVEKHGTARLAQLLGAGDPPKLSPLRFQRLIRAPEAELATALRRALPMAGKTCNVAALGRDLLNWTDPERGEATRIGWCFDYFGAPRPEHAGEAREEETDA